MRYLVTGYTGMDGSHLVEQLMMASTRNSVFAMVRGQRPVAAPASLSIVRADLTDYGSIYEAIKAVEPNVIFNLAAVTAIGMSWNQPALVADVNGAGVIRLLEAMRRLVPEARFVQASTADQFGEEAADATELDRFSPRSPYACAKQMAHDAVLTYREAYGLHASTAIMFNHSSERHGDEFVVRKITKAVAAIKRGDQRELLIGDMSAQRDWGYAPDYMRAWQLIAEQPEPSDYVLATRTLRSVQYLVELAFQVVGLDWQEYVAVDADYVRPNDVAARWGDPTKAESMLGWERSVDFPEMIKRMVEADL